MKIINETRRLVVYDDVSSPGTAGSENRVCLYRHDGVWQAAELPAWQYSHFYWLCGDDGFAQQAEEGLLLVKGERVAAEDYLALWRIAFGRARVYSDVPLLSISWDVCIENAILEANRADRKCRIGGHDSNADEVLSMTSAFGVIESRKGMSRWILPFGECRMGEIAEGLASLGSVRYALPAGSHRRLTVQCKDPAYAESAAEVEDQFDLLEAL